MRNLAPSIRKDLIQFKEPCLCNLRSEMSTFMTRKVRTAYHGCNLVTYLAPIICKQVPEALDSQTISQLNL